MIINGLDGYYTVFDTKNRNTELDTLTYNHTPSFAWKAIPSEARVTRDEVSGLQPHDKRLSGRQYQLMHYELCIMNYAL